MELKTKLPQSIDREISPLVINIINPKITSIFKQN